MDKVKNVFKLIFKRCKGWFITTVTVLLFLVLVTVVITQNTFLYGTIKTVLGGERRVLKAGDINKYQYYTVGENGDYGFKQFKPTAEIKNKKDALTQANKFNELIAEEGFILLKNENNALPIRTTESAVEKAAKNPKISVFGKNSVSLVYGGSGSAGGDTSTNVDLYQALEAAGYDCNPALRDFYKSSAAGKGRSKNPDMGTVTFGLQTGETPLASYTNKVKDSYADYSDAALVVISRIGGEGFDLPRTATDNKGKTLSGWDEGDHYLELDVNEEALLKEVHSKFDKVVLVINCATSMELGFIDDEQYGIDAAVWIASPGGTGINALGKILNGNVNPSGRTVDTYVRDFTTDPTWYNIGNNNVADGNRYYVGSTPQSYYTVSYEEGIYVGYRYWETMAYVQVEDEGNEEWYGEHVVYPFGYGLSYTNFRWELLSEQTAPAAGSSLGADDTISVTVRVYNEGDYAGKDVVQLYYNAPYRIGVANQIEKPHVVLGGYAKTDVIEADGYDDVTIELKVRDMAVYDYSDANKNTFKGYELDRGTYNIYLAKNAHESWAGDDTLSVRYSVSEAIKFEDENVKNRFDDAGEQIETYIQRDNFEATTPKAMPTREELTVDSAFINSLKYDQEKFDEAYGDRYITDKTFTTKGEGDYHLYDVIKFDEELKKLTVNYEDETFEKLLDMLTVEEMLNLICTGNFNTAYITSIDKPKTTDPDGPAGFTNFMGDPTVYGTCFYSSECVIAATYNKDIAYDMGVMVGIEGLFGNVKGDGRPYSGWYAPAVNIHRNQFAGRNWEYYSEDPLLSGKMGANVVQGAKTKGVYTYVKHFAVNDQETNRDSNGLVTWLNEQSLREIYLKPFEIIVKEGGTNAIMSSFNRIGKVWAGGNYELLTGVLRDEWGFKGIVITDYNLQSGGYMSPDQFLRAGGDLNLVQGGFPNSFKASNASSTEINLLRRATKNILFTVAQSNAMNGMGEGNVWGYALPTWVVILIVVDCAAAVAFGVWGFFAIRKAKKKEAAENSADASDNG